jgi:hypothetical protein
VAKLCGVGIVYLFFITVLFIWYLLQIVGKFKKNVTRQAWQALFHFGEYLFQSTRHFGECLKNMVSHTVITMYYLICSCDQISFLQTFLNPSHSSVFNSSIVLYLPCLSVSALHFHGSKYTHMDQSLPLWLKITKVYNYKYTHMDQSLPLWLKITKVYNYKYTHMDQSLK